MKSSEYLQRPTRLQTLELREQVQILAEEVEVTGEARQEINSRLITLEEKYKDLVQTIAITNAILIGIFVLFIMCYIVAKYGF